jgi:hypothetical protein
MGPDAELEERIAHAVGQDGELGVGVPAGGSHQRGVPAAPFAQVAIQEGRRQVRACSAPILGVHDPGSVATCSRIKPISRRVSVPSVASPSAALASAGSPQYARSMPIARKSV